jgi:DNA-binding CsgD family transcriptional regulator
MRDSQNISNPLFRITGYSASLTLRKPSTDDATDGGFSRELFIDGGYLNTPESPLAREGIRAEAPLVVINGPDAKLIMYDRVTLQNNYNGGSPAGTDEYRNGAGVFIRTAADDTAHQTEFVMKGGTIRGNINDTQAGIPCGGGVQITGFGLFTMEGGTIAANTAYRTGGGVNVGSRGSFKKNGGIIYGNDAAVKLANKVVDDGTGSPKAYGHAVFIAQLGGSDRFRDDTVIENSRLSYTGHAATNGIFGKGEKWSTHDQASRNYIIPIAAVLAALSLFVVLKKISAKALPAKGNERPELAPPHEVEQIAAETNLSPREKEIFVLLLKNLPLKAIARELNISYSTVNTHYNSIYRKLGVSSRGELLTKYGSR